MKNLSQDLFNNVRSFLSFKELHFSRNVSKSWANIEKVEAKVKSMEDIKSPFACLSNLIELCVNMEKYPGDIYIVMRCLSESRDSLRSISIDMIEEWLDIDQNSIQWVIPLLPNVTWLAVASDLALHKHLLRNCLNIHGLDISLTGEEFNEDLRQHSNLETITIRTGTIDESLPVTSFNISCVSMVKPSTIELICNCGSVEDLVHILQVKSHILLDLTCLFPSFRINMSLTPKKEIRIHSFRFVLPPNHEHNLQPGMTLFTRMLNAMKDAGCSTWTFNLSLPLMSYASFDVLYALEHSGFFSNEAIFNGCFKFKELT